MIIANPSSQSPPSEPLVSTSCTQGPIIDLTQPSSSNNLTLTQSKPVSTSSSAFAYQPLVPAISQSSTLRSLVQSQSSLRSPRSAPSNTQSLVTSLGPPIDLTLDESHDDDNDDVGEAQETKRPRLERDSEGRPKMPDFLAGVSIPEGPGRDGDECSVCLDPPLHPVTLPCGHVNCFTCAKGLTRQRSSALCSLCRQTIPLNFLDDSQVISEALKDVVKDAEEDEEDQQQWSWFYQGRNGWWRFEERNSEEIEETFMRGARQMEMMICGSLYVIDFARMEQFQKQCPNRKRKIKRDLQISDSKGIAGLSSNKVKKQ